VPTVENPINFRVEISGAGFLTKVVPVTIANVSTGIIPVQLIKPTEIPDGLEVIEEVVGLAPNGSLPVATTITLENPAGEDKVKIDITLPAGLQFQDENGAVITGGALTANVSAMDVNDPDALLSFPGGSLLAEGVVGPNGVEQSGAFNPAATTVIKMSVGGKSVRRFSQPIQIAMQVSPDFIDANTGQPVVAGTELSIYSYDETDPASVWQYEKNATVTGNAQTGFALNFAIDHLTTFVAGNFVASCESVSRVTFNADWMDEGFTLPIIISVEQFGKPLSTGVYSISKDANTVALTNVPNGGGVEIAVYTHVGVLIERAPVAACGVATIFNLPNPNPEPKVTLQLYVRCPGQADVLTILPTFELQYRVVGTNNWEYLGQVTNGFLQTAILKSDGTRYDFRAIWNNRVKIVNNKTVEEDNSGTVGIGNNDIIGERAGATNLAILTEECGKL